MSTITTKDGIELSGKDCGERDTAESAVSQLTGMRAVDNLIQVRPQTGPAAGGGRGERGEIFLVVRFRAPDYTRLKRAFDDLQPLRESHGARGHRILRLADDPHDYIVIIEFASSGGAKGFTKQPLLLRAIDAAAIEGGAHHVQYVEEFREQLEAVDYTW
jgi:hypothetical protein